MSDLPKHAKKWMDLKTTTMSKGSQTQKKYIPYDSIQMKFQNRENHPAMQKSGQWLPAEITYWEEE